MGDCRDGTSTDKGPIGPADKWVQGTDGRPQRKSTAALDELAGKGKSVRIIASDPGSPPPTPGQFDGSEPLRDDQLSATVQGGAVRGRRGRARLNPAMEPEERHRARRHSPYAGDRLVHLASLSEDGAAVYRRTPGGQSVAATYDLLTGAARGNPVRLLDPRPVGDNSWLDEPGVVAAGFEVTVPALAERLGSNLDPQHGPDARHGAPAAIEAALVEDLPPAGAVYTTVRPDADAFGAMAVSMLRGIDSPVLDDPAFHDRVRQIAEADRSATGPWRPGATGGDTVADTQVLGRLCSTHSVPADERVRQVTAWLATGTFDGADDIRSAVVAERDACRADVAARGGVRMTDDKKVAAVTSTRMLATHVAYEHAPVIAVSNPEMVLRVPDGEPVTYLKHTVARFNAQSADWDRAGLLDELNRLEKELGGDPGWGGPPDLLGSPQGVDSRISIDELPGIVARFVGVR